MWKSDTSKKGLELVDLLFFISPLYSGNCESFAELPEETPGAQGCNFCQKRWTQLPRGSQNHEGSR